MDSKLNDKNIIITKLLFEETVQFFFVFMFARNCKRLSNKFNIAIVVIVINHKTLHFLILL